MRARINSELNYTRRVRRMRIPRVGVRSSSSSSGTALIAASTFAAAAKNDEEQHRMQPGAAVASARKTIAGGIKIEIESGRSRAELIFRYNAVLVAANLSAYSAARVTIPHAVFVAYTYRYYGV